MADDSDTLSEKNDKSCRNNIKKIWTPEQDEKLKELVSLHGMGWTKIGEVFVERNGKQCRERWYNHLDPAVNKGEWTLEEDRVLFTMQKEIGNHWAKITKALPGRTDNAIKNRFNAACRNHSLLVAAAVAAGSSPREISLYDALHIHDAKTSPTGKLSNGSKISSEHAISADQADVRDSFYAPSSGATMPSFSPRGTRSYSPPNYTNVASKYQRVEVGLPQQQLTQQQYIHYQKQLYQQEHYLQHQHHMAIMQRHQHQMHLQQMQQHTIRQRAISLQMPSSESPYYPRPTSLSSPMQRMPSIELHKPYPTHDTDFDMVISPELFDRIALSNIPRDERDTHTSLPTIKVEPIKQEHIDAPRILTSSSSSSSRNKNIIPSDDVIAVSYEDADDGSVASRNNFNDGPIMSTTTHTANNNAGQFMDFDESIFDDWMSDDAEMDFIGTEETKKPSVYDYLPTGCGLSRPNICSNDTAPPYPSNTSTYAQSTNGMCCSFSTAHSHDSNKQHPYPGQRQYISPHGQPNVHQSVPIAKPKSTGFGSSIRALGNRFCGPGHVDTSYQQVDTIYNSKANAGGQPVMIKQEVHHPPMASIMNGGLTSMYGQNALREQYAKSRGKYENNSGVSTGSTYSQSQGYSQEALMKDAYISHFNGQLANNNSIPASIITTSYSNPAHRFATSPANIIPPSESSMQSYTDATRPQSIGHC